MIGRLSGGAAMPGHPGLLLAIALFMAACAGPEASSVPASSGSPTPTGAASSTGAPTVAPTEQPTPQNLIAWILGLGPGSPDGPPEFRAYQYLMEDGGGGCVTLADGLRDGSIELQGDARTLYAGVADACLAAFHGQAALWDSAAATFGALPLPTSCMDVAAYRLLGDLVAGHQQNPNGAFVPLTDPSQAQAPPCPVVSQLDPAQGPRGTEVRITGSNLDNVYEVWLYYEEEFGGAFSERAEYRPEGDTLVVTVVDDTNIALWACIVPQGAVGWNGSGKLFTFELAPGTSPPPTPPVPLVPSAPCPPESDE